MRKELVVQLLIWVPVIPLVAMDIYIKFTHPEMTQMQLLNATWCYTAAALVWLLSCAAVVIWREFRR